MGVQLTRRTLESSLFREGSASNLEVIVKPMRVITNNVPREITEAWQLTLAERDCFDFLDWTKIDVGEESASFVRYQGDLLYLGDFEGITDGFLKGWDGHISDSFFSGIVIKFGAELETVIVGRYYT